MRSWRDFNSQRDRVIVRHRRKGAAGTTRVMARAACKVPTAANRYAAWCCTQPLWIALTLER